MQFCPWCKCHCLYSIIVYPNQWCHHPQLMTRPTETNTSSVVYSSPAEAMRTFSHKSTISSHISEQKRYQRTPLKTVIMSTFKKRDKSDCGNCIKISPLSSPGPFSSILSKWLWRCSITLRHNRYYLQHIKSQRKCRKQHPLHIALLDDGASFWYLAAYTNPVFIIYLLYGRVQALCFTNRPITGWCQARLYLCPLFKFQSFFLQFWTWPSSIFPLGLKNVVDGEVWLVWATLYFLWWMMGLRKTGACSWG